VFAWLIPQMIVPYAHAAALMLASLDCGNATSRQRVGLALPAGMRGAEAALVGHSQSPQHKNPEQRHVARPPREATENMPLRKRARGPAHSAYLRTHESTRLSQIAQGL
jgi:hypothetical protein